jgi:hypothetical protein
VAGPYYGASANTMFYGGMSFDNQDGKMYLNQDSNLIIDWPNSIGMSRTCVLYSLLDPTQFAKFHEKMKDASTNIKAEFIYVCVHLYVFCSFVESIFHTTLSFQQSAWASGLCASLRRLHHG